MDRGWVLNQARDRWELLAADGEPTGYGVSRRYLGVYGPAGLNRELAARGLPPLDPAAPWWHLIMVGGPLDGLHAWEDPALHEDAPPEWLFVSAGTEVAFAAAARPAGADAAAVAGSAGVVIYRRAGAGCGHRGCPVAYVEDPGGGL